MAEDVLLRVASYPFETQHTTHLHILSLAATWNLRDFTEPASPFNFLLWRTALGCSLGLIPSPEIHNARFSMILLPAGAPPSDDSRGGITNAHTAATLITLLSISSIAWIDRFPGDRC